ncbi:hypothetical protein KJ854_03555 [Patescibacteria group bacterium]|nr:hypothetical protein [Patescibacteria group bacterium]
MLPKGYAGAVFHSINSETVCNFCIEHQERKFLGDKQLICDLNLDADERVGVTVSGGKDSLYAWMWLVDRLGSERVVAFNHRKVGLVHPIAEDNLRRAAKILNSEFVKFSDTEMLPRFRKNLAALLANPDPAIVRAALCAGCRTGISGKMFALGKSKSITKFVNAASYLELAPFKTALMKTKGDGNEKLGLLKGLKENPLYDHGDSIQTIMMDDDHCHKTQLAGWKSFELYPEIRYFDFDQYIPNIPSQYETAVRRRLGWNRPERSWHFDCLVESFKDVFYYGTLGYTETDYKLSAMIRHGLLSRDEAMDQLLIARKELIDNKEKTIELMKQLGVGHLISQMENFYKNSRFLSE